VPKDPFRGEELESESLDLVISSQMLEHNPYFWLTVAEMARVAIEEGAVAIVAPAAGSMHRHPLDCWRFYPDSWASMCAYVRLELIEAYRGYPSWKKTIPGMSRQDAMTVARKPQFDDEESRVHFYRRIDAIVATRTDAPEHFKRPQHLSTRNGDTAWRRCEEAHVFSPIQIILRRPLHLWQLLLEEITKLKETRVPRRAAPNLAPRWPSGPAPRRGTHAVVFQSHGGAHEL
jgi:SAM-dependent methyltransferase